MQQHDIAWDLPAPFTIDITVRAEDTDRLGHANNVVYVRWLEDVSWAHIESLGMSWALHEKTGKAMAITRTEIDYLASANTGDQLVLGTWLPGSSSWCVRRMAKPWSGRCPLTPVLI